MRVSGLPQSCALACDMVRARAHSMIPGQVAKELWRIVSEEPYAKDSVDKCCEHEQEEDIGDRND